MRENKAQYRFYMKMLQNSNRTEKTSNNNNMTNNKTNKNCSSGC